MVPVLTATLGTFRSELGPKAGVRGSIVGKNVEIK